MFSFIMYCYFYFWAILAFLYCVTKKILVFIYVLTLIWGIFIERYIVSFSTFVILYYQAFVFTVLIGLSLPMIYTIVTIYPTHWFMVNDWYFFVHYYTPYFYNPLYELTVVNVEIGLNTARALYEYLGLPKY